MKNLLLVLMMILMPLAALAQNDTDSDDAEEKAAAESLRKKGVDPTDVNLKRRTDGAVNNKGEPTKVPKVTCAGCEAQMTDGNFNDLPDETPNETQRLGLPTKKTDSAD